jgi:pimeloyl-ACP methyl ester carboxylesterase
MPIVRTKDGVDIFAYDWGSGPPVVLIHGWPLNADMWEHQGPPPGRQRLPRHRL